MEIKETDGSLSFGVRVIPRASRSEIVGEHDGMLKLRICSPPVDGAANAEVVRLLAKHFGVSRGSVTIISGETSKNKRIKIENLSVSKFKELLS